MLKYIVIVITIFTLVSCDTTKKKIFKEVGFEESNVSLGAYMLAVRGESKDLEMSPPLLLWTNPTYTKVKQITITERAKDSIDIDGSGKTCQLFSMTKNQIKRYFYISSKISESDRMNKLQWTDCYIGGNMIFENGLKAHWTIDAFMHGYIVFSDKNKDRSYDVYCPQCSYNF